MSQAPIAPFSTQLIPVSVNRPGDDPIFALHGEASKRAAAGEEILNSTIGALMEDDGRLAMLPSMVAALREVDQRQAAAYAPISGDPAFLNAVINDLYEGTDLAPLSVAVATPGGTGAIDAAIVNFLDIDQKLLTTDYYWGPYRILAEHNRRGVETFEMFREDGRFNKLAFERGLEALIEAQGRALIILNFPCHNPTGYSLDEEEWSAVTEIVRKAGAKAPVALLIDNAYAKFRAPGPEHWVRHVSAIAERAVVLVAWTISKAFAQYGARVGALVAVHHDEQERQRIKNALGYTCRGTWSNCNHLGMLAVTELLATPEKRAQSEEERLSLCGLLAQRVESFNEHAAKAGLKYPRYEGGFFVAVFTPDALETARHMRESHGAYVVPLKGAVRVALCAIAESQVPKLVEALADGVRAASQ